MLVLPFVLILWQLFVGVHGFVRYHGSPLAASRILGPSPAGTLLYGASRKVTSLPPGISPFVKTDAKSIDIQAKFRQLATQAVQQALRDQLSLVELEFPPLTGGAQSKTQFDDFDNLQELDANRDWCAQWIPSLSGSRVWFILPDDKECELAKKEWAGQRYQKGASFTSIRAAVEASCGSGEVVKAWGTTIASTMNRLTGGDGILADSSTLDELDPEEPRVNLVCQPGNGGPVEDWINVEKLHKVSDSPTIVVNGALDKVRDGYYPAVFFPSLAATVPFYKQFEAGLFLKPISDKGLYGWLFRVYPEPWQVVLQTPKQVTRGKSTLVEVTDTIALMSESRPTYQEAVQAMVSASNSQVVP